MAAYLSEYARQLQSLLLELDSASERREKLAALLEGESDRALQFRTRQNVILELGFFYGLLGWENVFVLFRLPGKVYPNFERPSDIDGAVFDSMDASGLWRGSLAQKLHEAGFRLTEPNEAERPTRSLPS